MPNWCFNSLEISGPAEELEKLQKQVKGEKTEFDFNKIIPYPEDFRKQDEIAHAQDDKREALAKEVGYEKASKKYPHMTDGYNSGGYMWCNDNWGTKWNVDADVQGDPKEECITYTFDSAWSPPEGIVKELGKQYPKLNFYHKYSEPGMCFYGHLTIEGGKVVEDVCEDMPTYKCKKCGSEQQLEPDDDEPECWECGECDWEEVKKKKKK